MVQNGLQVCSSPGRGPAAVFQSKEHEQMQEYDDDLLAHVDHIHDPAVLKRLLIQKEQERQGLSLNLDMAARLGLDLHQQLQRYEIESAAKLQSLQDENLALQSKANQSQELSYQLANSEHEVKELRGKNRFLQRELDTCRQELKTFRKDLDQLSEHMTQISAEMFDAKNKVNSYARRLGEVEQELVQTKELNVNLQVQLDSALQKQKQTQSSTTQVVKMIQSDLGRVFSDRDTMRLTLEELETRQMQCEGKVVEMMTNTREYAQLLEEAQETIHTMRIESDMEGRGWSGRGHHAAIWDNKTGEQPVAGGDSRPRNSRQLTASPTSINRYGSASLKDELDPMFNSGSWDRHHPGGMGSLEQELGIGTLDRELAGGFPRGLDQELQGFQHGRSLEDEFRGFNNPAGSLGDELRGSGHGGSLEDELRGFNHGMSLDQELRGFGRGGSLEQDLAGAQDPISEPIRGSLASELAGLKESPASSVVDDAATDAPSEETADEEIIRRSLDEEEDTYVTYMPQRLSLSAELHQRLEENNILQTVLTGRATWNVHSTIGITSAHSPIQNTPTTFRDIGRTLSMMTLPNQKSLPHPKNRIPSPLPSPKMPPSSKAGESSSTRSVSSSGIMSASGPSAGAHPGSSVTDPSDVQNILGLKYLLSASSSADLSNVITKAHTKTPAATAPTPLREKKTTRVPAPLTAVKEKPGPPSPTKEGRSSTPPVVKSSATATTTTSTATATPTSSSTMTTTTSGRPTPSRPIAFGSAESGGSRSGRKSTSPASSWSSSSSTSSNARRPSLAPNSGSLNSGKPKPPTNN
ncbi:hypothetical protein BGZ88_004670 [Linnemannia elongata]|nr:hypothetical protein BGZ88_004670 [Linnemannia elongata]